MFRTYSLTPTQSRGVRDIFLARNRALYVLINTNLTFRGKKLLKLLIKKTRLIKIFEVYWESIERYPLEGAGNRDMGT